MVIFRKPPNARLFLTQRFPFLKKNPFKIGNIHLFVYAKRNENSNIFISAYPQQWENRGKYFKWNFLRIKIKYLW